MQINAHNIKSVLMFYYRFKRQYICVDEAQTDGMSLADVLVYTGKGITEIEVKISKRDLFRGEARKSKHKKEDKNRAVNKFFICVPTELVGAAKDWVDKTNKKYGIIEFISNHKTPVYCYEKLIRIIKPASMLQPKCRPHLIERINKRLSSALTMLYIGKIT